MKNGRRKQVMGLIARQKRAIELAKTESEKAEAYGVWAGFLSGLWMTGAITGEEYDFLYAEMVKYQEIA